ncbi:MAG: hypothetical protein WCG95_05055, partial [bacterium]
MKIVINNLKISIDEPMEILKKAAAKKLNIDVKDIRHFRIIKESVDARKKSNIINSLKYVSYIIIAILLISEVIYFHFYTLNIFMLDIIFYITFILSVFLMLIWLTNIFLKKINESQILREMMRCKTLIMPNVKFISNYVTKGWKNGII